MKVSELKALDPLADAFELKPKTRYVIKLNDDHFVYEHLKSFSEALNAIDIHAVIVPASTEILELDRINGSCFVVDEHSVMIDGVRISRDIFKMMVDRANEGHVFRLLKAADEFGTVALETVTQAPTGSIP